MTAVAGFRSPLPRGNAGRPSHVGMGGGSSLRCHAHTTSAASFPGGLRPSSAAMQRCDNLRRVTRGIPPLSIRISGPPSPRCLKITSSVGSLPHSPIHRREPRNGSIILSEIADAPASPCGLIYSGHQSIRLNLPHKRPPAPAARSLRFPGDPAPCGPSSRPSRTPESVSTLPPAHPNESDDAFAWRFRLVSVFFRFHH